MNTDLPPIASLGTVRQLGYVVKDLRRSVEAWTARLGVGPWTLITNIPLQCVYRGEPSEPLIDIALGYRGDLQIELIQQKNDAPSPYLPFIVRGEFGLHHTAFISAQIDEDLRRAQGAGLELVCDIRMPAGRYVYLEPAVPGERGFIEVLEGTPAMLGMFEQGIRAAAEWTGGGEPMVIEFADLAAGR
jgi:methylmalonyl-CoA/ethylmalonyl-CoA epimerase